MRGLKESDNLLRVYSLSEVLQGVLGTFILDSNSLPFILGGLSYERGGDACQEF